MNKFKRKLYKKIKKNQLKNFGIENFDEDRFGPYPFPAAPRITKRNIIFYKKELKKIIKQAFCYDKCFNPVIVDNYINLYPKGIERVFNNLSDKDKDLFVSLIAYRFLGFKKVKLPRNNKNYWKALKKAKSLVDNNITINPNFLHFELKKSDLRTIGYDISLFYTESGIAIDFLVEQYAYKQKNKNIVAAEIGDIVLDLGGCWGDTALYFAHKVGKTGKVFSFEFIPNNISLFKKNISLNPNLINQIELVELPVTNKTGETIYFKDFGPGSKVLKESFEGQTGMAKTINIDDFVSFNNIEKIDFIKMDIEGSEMNALKGALNTIKKFRPKLAISIYHSKEDFVNIPNWILDLGYEIFLDHFTIHTEETICFARSK